MMKIYKQGNFDGACFLYSVANAYTALTGNNVSQSAWSKAIKEVPYLEDFINGGKNGGTTRYYDRPLLFEHVINQMFCVFNSKRSDVFVVKHVKTKDLRKLKDLISSGSVCIFCYETPEMNHWVCGTSYSEKPFAIKVACSYSSNKDELDTNFKRKTNGTIVTKDTQLFECSVFQVSVTA